MLVLFLFFVSLTNVFGYYLADLTLPAKQYAKPKYTHEECLKMEKVFFEDQCWVLLSKGPCDEGQWFVLDSVGEPDENGVPPMSHNNGQRPTVKGKCAKRRCSESDVYWPRDGFCYNADAARRLCTRPNTVLAIDEFGDGRCKCRDDEKAWLYVRVTAEGEGDDDGDGDGDLDSRQCYPTYGTEPCPRGQVVTAHGRGYGKCTVNKCDSSHGVDPEQPPLRSLHQRQQIKQQPPIASWTDGRCYELGSRGPCADNEQFIVLKDTMRPGCTAIKLAQLSLFGSYPNTTSDKNTTQCYTDNKGQCVEEVMVHNEIADNFVVHLFEVAKEHKERVKKKKKRTS